MLVMDCARDVPYLIRIVVFVLITIIALYAHIQILLLKMVFANVIRDSLKLEECASMKLDAQM